jgi:peptidoglycan hydrolase CwlO-like protein
MILAKDSQDVRDALNAAVSEATKDVKKIQDLIKEIDVKIAELNSAHRLHAKETIQETETELRDLFGQTSVLMQAVSKYNTGLFDDNQLKNLRKYVKTFEGLTLKNATLYHKAKGGPNEVLTAIQSDVTGTINLFAKTKEKLDTTERDINKTFNEIDNDKENFINTQEDLDKKFKKEVNTFKSTFDNYTQIVKTKSLVDMAGAIGQLASSMSALFNIPSILKNENLSSMEKFFQIMSSLFITLPMLSSAISVLKTN